MSHFDKAILEVLKHEGGYVNHPDDPGGETNFGITKRNYPSLDIKNLSKDEAITIYKRDYWLPILETFPFTIAAKVFDMIVNMGERQAVKLLQRALSDPSVIDDGVLGKKTSEAVIKVPENILLNNIIHQQTLFYETLVARKPALKVFLKGWLRRASWKPPKGD